MEQQHLGQSRLRVSVIGFGTMTFGDEGEKFAAMDQKNSADVARLVEIAFDHSVKLFDEPYFMSPCNLRILMSVRNNGTNAQLFNRQDRGRSSANITLCKGSRQGRDPLLAPRPCLRQIRYLPSDAEVVVTSRWDDAVYMESFEVALHGSVDPRKNEPSGEAQMHRP